MLQLLRILKKSLLFTLLIFAVCNIAKGQVAGKVYKDLNSNGIQNLPNEIGLSGYIVHAYLPNSIVPIITSTNSAGLFYYTSVEIPSGTKVRIEFPDLNNQKEGILGVDNKSSVQFHTAGVGAFASIGVLNSVDFCNLGGLEILTPCYVNGDPLVPGGSAGQDVALVKFPYNASGLAGNSGSPYPSMLATTADIGAVWGTAYQRRGSVFLMSALIRRHSGLGSLGTGGIYKYDDITNVVTPLIDVKTLGIDTGPDPHTTLTGDKLTPNTDPNTIPFTGKSGIGSITLSGDEKDLFIMNLYDRKIYSFTVGIPATTVNPSSVKSYTIPNGCGSGEFRPWALSEYQGNIYVGTVCSGETNQNFNDLKAIVYSLNPTSGIFTEVFQFPLTYIKGISDVTQSCPQYNKWNTWTDTFPQGCATTYDVGRGKTVNFVMYPQPILSGIGFDSDGSMIIGIMDRFGLWAGYRNLAPIDDGTLYDGFVGGDLLRAQFNSTSKTFTLESNASSGDLIGCGVNNGEGPGGGEFFCDDTWHFFGNPAHNEITNGAVLILPIDGSIISSAMDPVDEIYQSGGLRTYNRSNGELKYGYALYSDVPGTLGKSGGTGDIKASCGPAPIEIGNRVWKDLDFDGIQDPEELGISGVTVELFDITAGNILVGSTTTNSTGNYSFNNVNVVGGLKYENQYEIKIDISQSSLTSLGNIEISPSNAISGALSDLIDSDGLLSGTYTMVALTTGYAGETNYSIDFGITTCSPYLPTVAVTQPSCINPKGKIEITFPSGSSYSYSIDGSTFLPISVFDNLIPDTYKVVVKDNFGCVSDTVKVSFNPAPPIPSKPLLSIIQPSCQMSTGMISVSSPVGIGMTYSLDGTNFNNTTGVFNGLGQNTYTVWAKNNVGCVSDSAKGIINAQPTIPNKPILATVQPTCTLATGNITVSSPTGSGITYSLDGISFTNTTGVFNNLVAGNYSVWVKNALGCISDTSKTIILPQPSTPVKPVLTIDQPTCTLDTGKITVSSPTGAGLSYSLDGITFTNTTGVFNNLASGNYSVWVKNTLTCISDTSKAVILPQPTTPSKPVLTITQPTCTIATGKITVTSPIGAGLTYSFDGISFTNTTGVFDNLASGNYSVWVKNAFGCTDSTKTLINTAPHSPIKPILTITQPTCLTNTGSIEITDPLGAGFSYSIDGINFSNTSGIFNNLTPNSYLIWAKNSLGCSTMSDSAKIVAAKFPTNITASSNSPISLGETISLFSNSIEGISHSWTGPNGFVSNLQNPTITNAIMANAGIYTVTAKSIDNCTATATTSVEFLASMGNLAWFDQNRNGIQDDRVSPLGTYQGPELPAPGIILELYSSDDVLVGKDTTDANGLYGFNRLTAGTYYLKFDPISYPGVGFVVTDKNNGTDTTLDNDIERGVYRSANFTLTPGQHDPTWDIGFYRAGIPTITDPCICHDIIYDPDELYEFLEEVHVEGTPGDTWIVIEQTGMQRIDSLNNTPIEIGTELLPVEGHPGEYKLRFAHDATVGYSVVVFNGFDTLRISNLCFVPFFKSNVPTDSICAFNDPIKLIGQMLLDDVDVTNGTTKFFVVEGFENYGTTGNPIYTEISEFDPKAYLPGDTIDIVSHYTPYILSQCPVKKWYQFVLTADASCLAQIGDFVWNDKNKNGIQDASESGLPNVMVALLDGDKNPVIMDAFGNSLTGKTTDANGFYEFINLKPGDYHVQFGKPIDFIGTTIDAALANDQNDSDADITTGLSQKVTLANGVRNATVDAGFYFDIINCTKPANPIVSLTHPTCTVATGSIKVTSPLGTGYSYSIDGVNFANTDGIFTNLISGGYSVWVKNPQGCISQPTNIAITPQPIAPTKPILAITQPNCTDAIGKITVTSPSGVGLFYSLDGINFTNTSGVFNNLSAGNYSVWVRNLLGCTSQSTSGIINTQPIKPDAGLDKIIYLPITSAVLTPNPLGGTWTVSTGNIYSSSINNSGNVSGLINAGEYNFVYSLNTCSDTAKVTVICTKPTLTLGNIKCEGSTYSVAFYSSTANISPSAGIISGDRIINIPIGTNLSVKASNGTGCETVLDVISPEPCDPTCEFSNLYVGQPICKGTTYTVSYKVDFGTVTSNAGTVYGDSIVNVPIGTYLVVTATNTVGTAICNVHIAVPSPESCLNECTNPGVSVSGPICSGNNTYSVNYSLVSGASITTNFGIISSSKISNIPLDKTLIINVIKPGCADKQISVLPPTNCTPPCSSNAGTDKVVVLPNNSTTLTGTPIGGIWSALASNANSSNITSSGVVSNLNIAGEYYFMYKVGTCSDTAKVTVICTKPTLTLGNIKCEGSTYSVAFYSSTANISPSAGIISGDRVINIPIGTNLSVNASNGTGCETVLDVISPEPCDPTCEFSNLYVGQPICKGTTYTVSYKVDFGTVTSNAGTVYGDSIVNVPIGTYLVVTATNTVGTAICNVHIAVPSPESCLNECTNPGVSVSGPICSGNNTYSVNFTKQNDASISINYGAIVDSKITNIPTNKALIITAKKPGCADKQIVVNPPTNCVAPCKAICVPITFRKI